MDEWSCAVSEQPGKITVGDILSVSCQGEKPVAFNTAGLRIVFPQKEHSFRLYILAGSQPDPHSLDLQAASYRTGEFSDLPFIITDGNVSVRAKDLSFSVQSVWKKGAQIKPNPPFGPWTSPQPLWKTAWQAAALLLFLAGAAFFGRAVFQRRKFIKEVMRRRAENKEASPGKLFIRSIRGMDIAAPGFAPALARRFRIFLENRLFVPAKERSPEKILKSLKKHRRALYKGYGKRIAAALNETDRLAAESRRFSGQSERENILYELRENCIQLSLDLEKETEK